MDSADPPSAVAGAESAAANAAGAATSPSADEPNPLSKNQQKKARRLAHLQAGKAERRAKEREKKKEKKAEKRKLVEDGADPVEVGLVKRRRLGAEEKRPWRGTVVIDLSWDDKMNEKEIKSMTTQLSHCYNVNRNSPTPVENLIYTPLNGRLKARMDGAGGGQYKNWKGVSFSEAPLSELWKPSQTGSSDGSEERTGEGVMGKPDEDVPAPVAGGTNSSIRKEDVVYLTADSQTVLKKLEEGKTYIIGGIVDHNRYKNLCYSTANELGIKHAALPIGEYIQMASRRVLTVNQCFEIMVKWMETKDWEKAFYEVIPKRKFDEGGRKARRHRPDGNGAGADDAVAGSASENDEEEAHGDAVETAQDDPESAETPANDGDAVVEQSKGGD